MTQCPVQELEIPQWQCLASGFVASDIAGAGASGAAPGRAGQPAQATASTHQCVSTSARAHSGRVISFLDDDHDHCERQ